MTMKNTDTKQLARTKEEKQADLNIMEMVKNCNDENLSGKLH